jgi:hypothetical protein
VIGAIETGIEIPVETETVLETRVIEIEIEIGVIGTVTDSETEIERERTTEGVVGATEAAIATADEIETATGTIEDSEGAQTDVEVKR